MIPGSARLPFPSQDAGQPAAEHPAGREYLNLTRLPWTPYGPDLRGGHLLRA